MGPEITESPKNTRKNTPSSEQLEKRANECRPARAQTSECGFSLESECQPAKPRNRRKGPTKSSQRLPNNTQTELEGHRKPSKG